MTGEQPIEAAPVVEVPFGLGTALGVGVFAPATDSLDPEGRWGNAFGYGLEGMTCGRTGYTGDLCERPGPDTDVYQPLYGTQLGKAFRIGRGVKCSTFGQPANWLDLFHARADRLLELNQWTEVAFELWTGTQVPANRRLASPDADVLGPGAVAPVEAVSLLEDAFGVALSGGQRVIHVPTRLVAYLDHLGVIHQQGNRFYTALGTLVIADDGYPGTGPDGTMPADGSLWVYGTGPLTARIDPEVFHPEPTPVDAVNVRENLIQVRAEKKAAISWLCGHFAVNVKLCFH